MVNVSSAQCAVLGILYCCQKQSSKTWILIHHVIILAHAVFLIITTFTPASVPACHPASYGPCSRPQTQHRGIQITFGLLQALQAVGPKPVRCHTLLKQELINISSVDEEQARKCIQQARSWLNIYKNKESLRKCWENILLLTDTHIYIQICSHSQYKQIHSVHSVADMLYTRSATSLKPLTRSDMQWEEMLTTQLHSGRDWGKWQKSHGFDLSCNLQVCGSHHPHHMTQRIQCLGTKYCISSTGIHFLIGQNCFGGLHQFNIRQE